MVFDVQTSVYVPVMYVLMTGKSENMYWHALHWVYVCSNWKLDPFLVTCDFEAGLQKAVIGQFTNAILNGCLFHWKQAIRRKMKDIGIHSEQVEWGMTKDVLDYLTVIPRDEIRGKEIDYVQSIIDPHVETDEDKFKWGLFWEYFTRYWLSSDKVIASWNVYGEELVQNRTNNPLERYNRTLNDKFPTPHPSLLSFVTTIEEESCHQVTRLSDIHIQKTKKHL